MVCSLGRDKVYARGLLECMDCRIGFEIFRGDTVTSLQGNRGVERELAASSLEIVVFSVGGNDLDTAGGPRTLEVGRRLYEYVQTLEGKVVKKVVVCQIVSRQGWRHITQEEGIARVIEINELLRAVCND